MTDNDNRPMRNLMTSERTEIYQLRCSRNNANIKIFAYKNHTEVYGFGHCAKNKENNAHKFVLHLFVQRLRSHIDLTYVDYVWRFYCFCCCSVLALSQAFTSFFICSYDCCHPLFAVLLHFSAVVSSLLFICISRLFFVVVVVYSFTVDVRNKSTINCEYVSCALVLTLSRHIYAFTHVTVNSLFFDSLVLIFNPKVSRAQQL